MRSPSAAATNSSLALTGGLLRTLNLCGNWRACLAHEIAHIAHNDTRVMALADVISRLTRAMSYIGLLLLLVNLPLLLGNGEGHSLAAGDPADRRAHCRHAAAIGLVAHPRVRRRSGSGPADRRRRLALVSALEKMERRSGRMWEEIFLPGRRIPGPSVLRTHPLTEDRVSRLRALRTPSGPELLLSDDGTAHHGSVPEVPRRPRHRWSGIWY